MNTILRNMICGLALLLSGVCMAQPTWRFHLAFEDATGARDTIWFVYDTTATLGWDGDPQVDVALGEGSVEMNLNVFNVWVYNWGLDSTKTIAFPYTNFPYHSASIEAFNFQFPVTLRWDTALFHAGYLPDPYAINVARMDCNHFFSFNNDPPLQAYNMLLDDSVIVEMMFPNDALFPLGVGFSHDDLMSLPTRANQAMGCVVFPNPAKDQVTLACPERLLKVRVLDGYSHQVLEHRMGIAGVPLDVSQLPAGLYFIEGLTTSYHRYHAKFIKQD